MNTDDALRPGNFTFGGYLGERIDSVARARIGSREARATIYPETEEAFRRRVDDRMNPGRGMWQGEFWGKWILAAVAAYRYYHDGKMADQVDRGEEATDEHGAAQGQAHELRSFIHEAALGVISTQDGDGYIGTYSDSTFFGPGTWNIWTRKYTLWGLVESYRISGDRRILDAAVAFCDHLIGEVGPDAFDIVRTGQFNGLPSTSILSPVLLLYEETGQQRFLRFGTYIVDQWGRHPDGPPDLLGKGLADEPIHTWFPHPEDWAKSYELISCVEGMVDLYRATGESKYLRAAQNIHRQIVLWERSPVGSVSFNDKFVGSRYLRNVVAEICDIVYWNRLCHTLFLVTGDAGYADEIERSLYNGLLVAPNPEGTWGLRRLRVTHEHIPAHPHCKLEHHQCCVDNLPRGYFQAAETALMCDAEGIRIIFLNPGAGAVELPSGNKVHVEIGGDYPYAGAIPISITLDAPEDIGIRVRVPDWLLKAGGTLSIVDGPATDTGPIADAPGGRLPSGVAAGRAAGGAGQLDGRWLVVRPGRASRVDLSLEVPLDLRVEWFEPAAGPGQAEAPEPAASGPTIDPAVVHRHEQEWPAMGVIVEGQGQKTNLGPADVQPNTRSGMLFRGPLALGLDRRLLGESPFDGTHHAIAESDLSGASVSVSRGDCGPVVGVSLPDGRRLLLLPFACLGATWDSRSEFTCWTVE